MSNGTDDKLQQKWDSIKEKAMKNAQEKLDQQDETEGYNAAMAGEVCPPSASDFFKKGFAKAEQEKQDRRKNQILKK